MFRGKALGWMAGTLIWMPGAPRAPRATVPPSKLPWAPGVAESRLRHRCRLVPPVCACRPGEDKEWGDDRVRPWWRYPEESNGQRPHG